MKSVREILSYLIWPALMGLCVGLTVYGFSTGKPVITFNLVYLSLALTLLVLERLMPHERTWLEADGQTFANIAHTLLSKGVVQGLIIFGGVIGLTSMITGLDQPGYSIWPREWPLFLQVPLGLVAAEFGLYWAHRLAHIWYPLWRFHAIHHSVTRLWVINTGRFHFVDSVFSILLGVSILFILGAPLEVITWLSALTAYIGLLTHCNIEMRFGPISWVFNTPGLHRWHHSRNLEEGNRNFCENLMIWDQVFGTYINPPRRPPADIGVKEDIPASFVKQLAWPFKTFREEKA
ncbi:MAG: sterol desaturase family protein [Rhodospirillales bacterium]|nr:sterol desaturase family protein [Alphaproteobacteria bacterium]USO03784.1 MAG: sterol desaturase family protein [Rhodospirillales bacterium]